MQRLVSEGSFFLPPRHILTLSHTTMIGVVNTPLVLTTRYWGVKHLTLIKQDLGPKITCLDKDESFYKRVNQILPRLQWFLQD